MLKHGRLPQQTKCWFHRLCVSFREMQLFFQVKLWFCRLSDCAFIQFEHYMLLWKHWNWYKVNAFVLIFFILKILICERSLKCEALFLVQLLVSTKFGTLFMKSIPVSSITLQYPIVRERCSGVLGFLSEGKIPPLLLVNSQDSI